MSDALHRLLDWLDLPSTHDQMEALRTYHGWLASEAGAAGGVGPRELERLWDRHIFDSLCFWAVLDDASTGPVIDVGSGVGLPGVPLAITRPDRQFFLVDRSGGRIRLLRRALRVLGIENAEPVESDVRDIDFAGKTIVSRAAVSPKTLLDQARAGGLPAEVVVAASRTAPIEVEGFDLVEVRSEILATPAWFLRMAPP